MAVCAAPRLPCEFAFTLTDCSVLHFCLFNYRYLNCRDAEINHHACVLKDQCSTMQNLQQLFTAQPHGVHSPMQSASWHVGGRSCQPSQNEKAHVLKGTAVTLAALLPALLLNSESKVLMAPPATSALGSWLNTPVDTLLAAWLLLNTVLTSL